MKRLRFPVVLTVTILPLLVLMSSVATASAGEDYEYSAYSFDGLERRIVISMDRSAVYVGHAGRRARFCEGIDDYVCIRSPVFDFAVPKSGLQEISAWEKDGSGYRVLRKIEMSVLGRCKVVFVIRQTRSSQDVALFWYSLSDGLIGFSLEKEGETFLLNGERGFPIVDSK